MDTDLTPGPQRILSVAEIADTFSQSVGNPYSDDAAGGDNVSLQHLMCAELCRSNEETKGRAYVQRFRRDQITNDKIPVPCQSCGEPIPKARLEAKNFAATNCTPCQDKIEAAASRRR